MNFALYTALFLSVIVSGLSVLFLKISGRQLKLVLSFSGAFLFAISVLHLIPETYESGGHEIGIYILAGFFLQILLEFFSEGIEHGHIHVHHHDKTFPFTMMAGLSIHSFLEGMPLSGHSHGHEHHYQDSLLIGIIIHNIPIAIALMSMFIQSNVKRSTAILMLVVFALVTPLGTLTAHLAGANMEGDLSAWFDRIMAVVIGIFLHISTTILFESNEGHRFNFLKFAVIIAGATVAFFTA